MANEKRLIDANDFIKHFWQRVHDGEIVTLMDAEHAIINAPTVDAVEVVRCKDCIFFKPGAPFKHRCENMVGGMYYVSRDDFCSYGERRTDV